MSLVPDLSAFLFSASGHDGPLSGTQFALPHFRPSLGMWAQPLAASWVSLSWRINATVSWTDSETA